MKPQRVYTVGNPAENLYISMYWHQDALHYAFDAHHLSDAELWQNKVEAMNAIHQLSLEGMYVNGCRLLAFDCIEVINP